MRMLAFDTCLGATSAAVLHVDHAGDHAQIIARRAEPMQRGHAERLLPMIAEVLSEACVAAGDVDRIAVTEGPGTFTGIRTGVAAARALALATGKPVMATTSLALLAATARRLGSAPVPGAPLVVALDARKSEIYLQVLEADGRAATPALVLSPADGVRRLTALGIAAPLGVIGSGAPALIAAAPPGLWLVAGNVAVEPDAADMPAARPTPRALLVPLYLRAADAVPQDHSLPSMLARQP